MQRGCGTVLGDSSSSSICARKSYSWVIGSHSMSAMAAVRVPVEEFKRRRFMMLTPGHKETWGALPPSDLVWRLGGVTLTL